MADVQKPTEVPAAAPAVATEPVVAETTAPVATTTTDAAPETTPAVEAAKTDDVVPAAEEANAEEEVAAAPVAEEKKAEPVEAGVLEHKGSPASFPKNIMYSKNFFYFGNEPVAAEKLSAYQKGEKVGEVAQHVISWAAHTGKGLLFIAKDGDKSTPVGAIQLAEASEPATDGTNKFHFTAKGHKHTFKASSAAERDSWVDQLKAKIAEAKELAATVTESEAYKSTLESFQPAKKETVAEPTKEVDATEVKNDETVAPIPVIEEPVTEAKSDEAVKEEIKKEEPKRRSASRKRNSLFGNLLGGKKDDAKKEETKEEIKPETAVVAEDVKPEVAATEPATETPAVASTETPVVATEVTAEAPAAVEKTEAPAAVEKTEAPVKPVPTKRSSIFGGSFFGKKKLESDSTPVSPSTETAPVTESAAPVAENAPVIPAVETSAPLSAEVSSPATVPTETTEAAPATAPIETRPQMKSDKRKSSLPFLSKKEKTASSDEEGDKPKGGYFSKLRQTVKGKKTVEKPAEDKTVEEAAVAPAPEAVKTEETPVVEAAKAHEVKADEAVVAAPATESAPVAEKPATTIAPVTAAA